MGLTASEEQDECLAIQVQVPKRKAKSPFGVVEPGAEYPGRFLQIFKPKFEARVSTILSYGDIGATTLKLAQQDSEIIPTWQGRSAGIEITFSSTQGVSMCVV